MSKHRVTLKDLAERLGVTVTTVSKALRDYPDISEETKREVKELAAALNYHPDSQALALRGNRSYTIGLIIPEIVHFFFSNVINGILNVAEKQGYRLLITISRNERAEEKKQVNLLFNTKVDGVIVSLANETHDASHFKVLSEYEIPLVMFDKVDQHFDCSKVIIDDHKGAFVATQHLIDKGCKRIAHIRGPLTPSNSIGRFEGYKTALQAAGITPDPRLVKVCHEVTLDEGYAFTKELLQSENPPDGIFSVTDQVGVGALRAAQDMGIEVPAQLKIVGFSDSLIARVAYPALSTIYQPGYEIGEAAARLIIEEIEWKAKNGNQPKAHKELVLETHLIQRGSS